MKIEKIVLISSNGVRLDEHFGQGTKFWFYQLELEEMVFQKVCEVKRDREQVPHQQLRNIIEQLENCDAVVAQKIGNGAKHILAEYEIYPLEYGGTIQSAIEKLLKYIIKNN